MVPSVESFQTEFETATARFAQGKALEQGHVPVVAARTTQGVVAQRAPRGRCGGYRLGRKGPPGGGLGFLCGLGGGGGGKPGPRGGEKAAAKRRGGGPRSLSAPSPPPARRDVGGRSLRP